MYTTYQMFYHYVTDNNDRLLQTISIDFFYVLPNHVLYTVYSDIWIEKHTTSSVHNSQKMDVNHKIDVPN